MDCTRRKRTLWILVPALAMALAAGACGGSSADGAAQPAADADAVVADAPADDSANAGADGDAAEPPDAGPDGAEVGDVTVTGDPLPQVEGGGILSDAADPANGSIVPTLSGTNFNGGNVTIGADGRPKAVYFLAHWCPHCQEEVDLINKLAADGKIPSGIDLYAVTVAVDETRDNYPPSEWLADFPGTVLRDSAANDGGLAAGLSGIPYVLYMDGENRLLSRSIGTLSEAEILSQWQSVLTR